MGTHYYLHKVEELCTPPAYILILQELQIMTVQTSGMYVPV